MIKTWLSLTVFAPMVAAIITGLGNRRVGVRGATYITIIGMLISFCSAWMMFYDVVFGGAAVYNAFWYTWAVSGTFAFHVGFLVDHLTVIMMLTVTFVSLLVHIYSIGYMKGDGGYARFFCYMSLFTFFMLMLVGANNLLQLFFGWEGVGLVSYLLIGFWFQKDSAAVGSFKAFIVNRVGDCSFVLGIAAVLTTFGSLSYSRIFDNTDLLYHATVTIIPGHPWSLASVICILLFIGAMAKSAQLPLHIWLPESMEGPTPISALIHAATMVTAGVYMVARLSPIYVLSTTALSMILILGATGALFLGLIALVETDIKRVIAYSTISQLGYMMAANGAAVFSAGIFHLVTHACFKALLFLGAGSVILAMHHEQDMRKMGGLRRYLPITYITFLIGSLALAAIPPFAGFYSKDAIIEAVHLSSIPGAHYSYLCLLLGGFVTALYTFRAFFKTFHGKPQESYKEHPPHESPWVVWLPLVLLAIPSVILGAILAKPMLYAKHTWLAGSVNTTTAYNVLPVMAKDFHGAMAAMIHSIATPVFWLSTLGVVLAWLCYVLKPGLPDIAKKRLVLVFTILNDHYGFDRFNQWVFVRGTRALSQFLYRFTDVTVIDHFMVNGSGRNVNRAAKSAKKLQSGYLYHYALVMIIGLVVFLCWAIFGR